MTIDMNKKMPVDPLKPTKDAGVYWGYKVRLAKSLKDVFAESPYEGGYDCAIGTSENGKDVGNMNLKRKFKHVIIVFGGLAGLEAAVEADESLQNSKR